MEPLESLFVAEPGSDGYYDLEERTFQFAKSVRLFVKRLQKTVATIEDSRQVIRSSGSVGANYREAIDALGDKDRVMRLRISREEAKESTYWLRLILETNHLNNADEASRLIQEGNELRKILSAIITNVVDKQKRAT